MIDKQQLLDLDRDDLVKLTVDVLKALTLKTAKEDNDYNIPDGFKLRSFNKNVKWTFDISIKEDLTAAGKKDFDEFCNSKRIDEAAKLFYGGPLFKSVIHPEDLDES